MAYITREDGERFIIPSYRDVLRAKKPNLLKREILLLSANYGEYITLQRKSAQQYEVAFSPEPGFLLGETVWSFFKRPNDLIYCEAIPNTTDVILVIVKAGSVYLDGSFPADSIPEELIVFQTQQNEFDIYIQGDVPISQTPEEGKFAFDPSSVKSFTELDKPVFATLPTMKAFQLQLVDVVLKQQGIGVYPYKPILAVVALIAIGWMVWSYISSHQKTLPPAIIGVVNPLQAYLNAISTPDPVAQINNLTEQVKLLYTIPGWVPSKIVYQSGLTTADVKSLGARTEQLFAWAKKHGAKVIITPLGFVVQLTANFNNRIPQNDSIPIALDQMIGKIIDRIAVVYPGEHLRVASFFDRGLYTEARVVIDFTDISPDTLNLLGQQLASLPVVLSDVSLDNDNSSLTGKISFNALGK